MSHAKSGEWKPAHRCSLPPLHEQHHRTMVSDDRGQPAHKEAVYKMGVVRVSRIKIFVALAICATVGSALDATQCHNCLTIKHFTRRSDSRQRPLQLVGDYHYTHLRQADSWYGLLSVTPTYRASFRYEDITDELLGSGRCSEQCGDCTQIRVQGSAVPSRGPKAWLADHFYLPRNYNGSFEIRPTIKTPSIMFDLFMGSRCGAYLRLFGPIAHSRWDLRFREFNTGSCCEAQGLLYTDSQGVETGIPMNHSCGYFSQAEYDGRKLVRTFREFMSGAKPQESEGSSIKWNALKYAKMICCSRQETGLADLRMELGYDFLHSHQYRLALNIQGAAPTGKVKEPCYLFDAMVGNGNHWELGGGLNGHYRLWEDDEGDLALDFVFDVNVTHMFKKQQWRTFDLKCKANGAYMLAAKFGDNKEHPAPPLAKDATDFQVGWAANSTAAPDTPANLGTAPPTPNRQFALEYAPVANLSTVKVDVSVGAHVDAVAMLHYTCGNMYWDLGYNFWARSCEKIQCPQAKCNCNTICDPANKDTWALKGDARMFGFQLVTNATGPGQPLANRTLKSIPLSATQSSASIYCGSNEVMSEYLVENNATTLSNTSKRDINRHVDSAVYAFVISPLDGFTPPGAAPLSLSCEKTDPTFRLLPTDGNNVYSNLQTTGSTDYQIKTSSTPVFLSCSDLALTRTRGISHTVFSHLSYGCTGDRWDPYLGVGVSIEFGNNTDTCCMDTLCCTDCCDSNCNGGAISLDACCNNTCIDTAVSQWSIWLKCGLAFKNEKATWCRMRADQYIKHNKASNRKKQYAKKYINTKKQSYCRLKKR